MGNLLSFSYGSLTGWATINFVELQSESTTSPSGRLTLEEATLVVSIAGFGGLIGTFAIVPISRKFGIKRTIHLFGIPLLMSILLIIWAQNKYYLYLSRSLGGFVGGGLCVGLPMLIADISHNEVRGTLNSMYDPSYNLGIIFSFFIGSYFDCVDQAKIHLIAPSIFLIVLSYLPESPEFHWQQNREKRAIKSQKFFKGKDSVAEQVKFLTNAVVENGNVESKPEAKCAEDEDRDGMTLSDFLTPRAKRALFISFTSMALSFVSGVLVILNFVTAIFYETGSTLDPKTSSTLVSVSQLTANIILLNIVDRFNRRTLFIISSVLTAIAYIVFGLHSLFWTNIPGLEWMPPVCFASIIFCGCLGLLPIPYIVTIEIFPEKIRNVCIAIAVSMLWLVLFLLGSAYPIVQEAIGLPACMFGFGAVCLISAAFGFWFVPETRGKSYDEIMTMLSE